MRPFGIFIHSWYVVNPAGLRTVADLVVTQYLQQHINRAERRHALMSGRTGPSDEELSARLRKRMYIVGDAPVKTGRLPRDKKLHKRYNPATAMLNKFRQKLSNLTPSQLKAATNPVFAANETGVGGVGSSNVNAAFADTLTPANAPTAHNSLGLSIDAIDTGCELSAYSSPLQMTDSVQILHRCNWERRQQTFRF